MTNFLFTIRCIRVGCRLPSSRRRSYAFTWTFIGLSRRRLILISPVRIRRQSSFVLLRARVSSVPEITFSGTRLALLGIL